nr:MAG TPA: hypothetical protein [Caudoviricetes sp.]
MYTNPLKSLRSVNRSLEFTFKSKIFSYCALI